MYFHLIVIGHKDSLQDVEAICTHKFSGVVVNKIPFNSDDDLDAASEALSQAMPFCDGILYTRQDPYKLLTRIIEHTVPSRYVDITADHFICGLLKASVLYDVDVRTVSLDTLSYDSVQHVYKELNLSLEKIAPIRVSINNKAYGFVQKVQYEHLENYRSGKCSACITSIRSVYDFLKQQQVPTILMSPDEKDYISEIRRLVLLPQYEEKPVSEHLILSIYATHRNEFYISNQPLLLEATDVSKLIETIAYFAQSINGALITVSHTEYHIICSENDLKAVTEGLSRFDLLQLVCSNTAYTISVGIGYGKTALQAKMNAQIGLRRAMQEGSNRAYIVYGPAKLIGPIEPNEVKKPGNAFIEHRIVTLAESAGISVQTFYEIDCLIKTQNKKTLTAQDIAQTLGVSHRTANRLIEKLEAANLLVESGKYNPGSRGRPSRIMKAIF